MHRPTRHIGLSRKKRGLLDCAFEELLSEHLDALYQASLRFCGGREADAEDLLQEAVLRAFRGFNTLERAAAGRSWLFTILFRTFLNGLRTVERRAEVLSNDLDESAFEAALERWAPSLTPEEAAERHAFVEQFLAVLDDLHAGLRIVIWLVDVEGFAQREVAEMLGVAEGTVASRLYRGRQQLRNALMDTAQDATWRRR